jgi:hypothetical protein
VVSFEFAGTVYSLGEDEATLLAETLRNYAKGKLPEAERQVAGLSGNVRWAEGALAVADFTEEVLVGNYDGPIPLEGKAAEATFWTLRMMKRNGETPDSGGALALRDALAGHFAALQS